MAEKEDPPSQLTGTRVDTQCSLCRAQLEKSPQCGRVMLGGSDGSMLMVRQYCGDCWPAVGEMVTRYVLSVERTMRRKS